MFRQPKVTATTSTSASLPVVIDPIVPNEIKTSALSQEHSARVFSKKIHSMQVTPVVSIVYGGAVAGNICSTWEQLINRDTYGSIMPLSYFNRGLLGEKLPRKQLTKRMDLAGDHLPTFAVASAPSFDIIDALNAAKLSLPSSFFLEMPKDDETILDTALSTEGLRQLMSNYATLMNNHSFVFSNSDHFSNNLSSVIACAKEKPVCCLVCYEGSKRHVTGIYFICKNEEITAYVFDTTGITLPAEPCGTRDYSKNNNHELFFDMKALAQMDVSIAVMPVNTAISIQNDKFSCLMATLLFFNGMMAGDYHFVENVGIVNCFGDSSFISDGESLRFRHIVVCDSIKGRGLIKAYVMNHVPLLVGCQSRLAYVVMMDSLTNATDLFPRCVELMTDWQRRKDQTITNAFWQVAYVELLKWFNHCYLAKAAIPLPDFTELVTGGFPGRTEKSAFEQKIMVLQEKELAAVIAAQPELSIRLEPSPPSTSSTVTTCPPVRAETPITTFVPVAKKSKKPTPVRAETPITTSVPVAKKSKKLTTVCQTLRPRPLPTHFYAVTEQTIIARAGKTEFSLEEQRQLLPPTNRCFLYSTTEQAQTQLRKMTKTAGFWRTTRPLLFKVTTNTPLVDFAEGMPVECRQLNSIMSYLQDAALEQTEILQAHQAAQQIKRLVVQAYKEYETVSNSTTSTDPSELGYTISTIRQLGPTHGPDGLARALAFQESLADLAYPELIQAINAYAAGRFNGNFEHGKSFKAILYQHVIQRYGTQAQKDNLPTATINKETLLDAIAQMEQVVKQQVLNQETSQQPALNIG